MSSLRQSKVDVLIIGAGPAGLMCGNALANARVNVRIVDERATRIKAGQADVLQPRTIEVLQSYGLAERPLRDGSRINVTSFYDPDPAGGIRLSGRIPAISASSARYPFEIGLHQGEIEAMFLDSMRLLGVEVEQSTFPTDIELSADETELADPTSHPVKVTLAHVVKPNEEPDKEIVHAKFVLGADGTHSWVRQHFGISMDGEQTDQVWGVLDMIPDTDFPDIRNKVLLRSETGSCKFIPREGDTIRCYIPVAGTDVWNPDTGRVDKERMGPDQLLELMNQYLSPYSINPTNGVDWWTLYSVGQRVASKFSVKDRVFLAGDACHTHSLQAGQGMNASMNDGHNLAWKLAFVIRGWADMSLLSTYQSERRKHAQDLIAFDKIWSAIFSGKPLTSDNIYGVSHAELQKTFRAFGKSTSGTGVHYGPSVAVADRHQSLATNLTIGDRVPPQVFLRAADARPYELQDLLPSNFRYKLLVFTGNLEHPLQWARVKSLAKDLQQSKSFLTRYSSNESSESRFDVITISKGRKEVFDFLALPSLLRPHWSKVLLDDMDITGSVGGRGYSYYGVGDEGAIVMVRPDGHVATIAPLDGVSEIDDYFARFANS